MPNTWKAYRNILNGLPNDELRRVAVYHTKIEWIPEEREKLIDVLASEYEKSGTIEPLFSFVEAHINSIYKPMFTAVNISYGNGAVVIRRLVHIRDEQNESHRLTFYWRYYADGTQSFEANISGVAEHEKSLFLSYYDWKYNVPSYDSVTEEKWKAFLQMCHFYHQHPAHRYGYTQHIPYDVEEHFFYMTVNDYPVPLELIYQKKKCEQITIPGICDNDLRELFNLEEIEHFIEEKAPSRLLFLFE